MLVNTLEFAQIAVRCSVGMYKYNLCYGLVGEMKSRIAVGNRCFYSPRQIFGSRPTSKSVKIKICKTMVEPAVVFGSETWPMTEMYVTRLGT